MTTTNLAEPQKKTMSIRKTRANDASSLPLCSKCGELCGFIHIDEFLFALRTTRASLLGVRVMRGTWVSVCPQCDAYLLMQEFDCGVPFYSVRDMAVIAIADSDHMNTTPLLEFGNLPFTKNALLGAFHVACKSSAEDGIRIELPDRNLLGPTGIPDDERATHEWRSQLEKLASMLPEKADTSGLDAAISRVIRQVPNDP